MCRAHANRCLSAHPALARTPPRISETRAPSRNPGQGSIARAAPRVVDPSRLVVGGGHRRRQHPAGARGNLARGALSALLARRDGPHRSRGRRASEVPHRLRQGGGVRHPRRERAHANQLRHRRAPAVEVSVLGGVPVPPAGRLQPASDGDADPGVHAGEQRDGILPPHRIVRPEETRQLRRRRRGRTRRGGEAARRKDDEPALTGGPPGVPGEQVVRQQVQTVRVRRAREL